MFMSKYCFFIFYLLMQSGNLFCQVLTMDSIVFQMDKQYPELQMFDYQIKALDAYAKGARAWDAPQVGTGFFMTPYNTKFWTPNSMDVKGVPSVNPGMGMYMIQVQQMIPNPSKQRANQKYMAGMSAVEYENKSVMRNQLVAAAKSNYYGWLVLKKKQKILAANEMLMKYIVESSETRYAYQQDKLNSIFKAKSELLKINNMQLMLDNDGNEKMIELNRLMNRNKNTVFSIDTTYSIKNYDVEPADTAAIIGFRSDIKALENNIQVAKLKQQYEYSKRRPDFGLRYDHMFAFGDNPNLFSLMGMVTIPIVPWSSKMYKSNVTGLGFELQAYQKQKEAIVNEVAAKLSMLKVQLANKKRQLKLYETGILPALTKNYKIVLLAYEQNTEDLFVVLDAIQNLQMIQIEYLDRLQELLLLQVEYEKQVEQKK